MEALGRNARAIILVAGDACFDPPSFDMALIGSRMEPRV
ncbi:hypothetical protein GGD83_002459 [Rhodoblastus sphagnicola]|nr:hypothetical protein [Rhodoblastus sphagnicola]